MKKQQQITGGTFFSLALYSFLGLGMEVVLLNVEQLIYGISLSEFTYLQNILHWVITCIIWVAFAALLVRASKMKYQYDLLSDGKNEHVPIRNSVFAIILAVACIGVNAIGWGTLKIIGEFTKKPLGIFLFQYFYYMIEAILVFLIVCFGQRAGEKWFHSTKIPWGGITVGLTWGLVHALTKGSIEVGLSAMLAGVLYGGINLLLKKKALPSYILIFLAFSI